MIGLIEYQKAQGLCQGTCHFNWIYMALKSPRIGILNEIFFFI